MKNKFYRGLVCCSVLVLGLTNALSQEDQVQENVSNNNESIFVSTTRTCRH